jgi:hypothetical protein
MTFAADIHRNYRATTAAPQFGIESFETRSPVSLPAYAYRLPVKLPVVPSPIFQLIFRPKMHASLF